MRVAFVGCSPSRVKAPWDDPSWSLWTQADTTAPRWDRWLELHDLDALPAEYDYLRDFLFTLDGSKPVFMRDAHPRVKGSVAYPKQQIIDRFGSHFLTSTCAWAIALAIHEGADEIGLWGVDMADSGEYSEQKPGCRAFLMLARQLGIKITLPPECELLGDGEIYALGDSALAAKVNGRKQELLGQQRSFLAEKAKYEAAIKELDQKLWFLEGAIGACVHAERNWIK